MKLILVFWIGIIWTPLIQANISIDGKRFYRLLREEIQKVGDPGKWMEACTEEEHLLAAVIVAEAGLEGIGQMAVAEVIQVRCRERNLSPGDVVRQKYQFSCLNSRSPDALIQKMKPHPEYLIALKLARITCRAPDLFPNITRGANHYHANWIKPPYWAKNHEPVAIIGNHVFYRIH